MPVVLIGGAFIERSFLTVGWLLEVVILALLVAFFFIRLCLISGRPESVIYLRKMSLLTLYPSGRVSCSKSSVAVASDMPISSGMSVGNNDLVR